MAPKPLTVLLTNDDGPPGVASPYIYGLYKHLTRSLGWDVRVVIPSSQKSWIGKAYQIRDIIPGRFYYPRDPDGLLGETSDSPRPLKEGEIGEWILLDGTPATCSNIALHNLYPGEIDLLVGSDLPTLPFVPSSSQLKAPIYPPSIQLSGPNLGRNTSCAFALSSGTLGAALSSALSQARSIALSYGTVESPPPQAFFDPAHALSAKIIRHLWDNWGKDSTGLRNGEIDFYSVNIPMIQGLLSEDGLPIIWTRLWRNSYHRLFKACSPERAAELDRPSLQAGPDSTAIVPAQTNSQEAGGKVSPKRLGGLLFEFSPDMKEFINLPPASLLEGSDSWAIEMGLVSVTPMRASFGEPPAEDVFPPGGTTQDRIWKIRL